MIRLTVPEVKSYAKGVIKYEPELRRSLGATLDELMWVQGQLRNLLDGEFNKTFSNPDYLTAVIAYVNGTDFANYEELYENFVTVDYIFNADMDGVCACGHEGLKHISIIQSKTTGYVALVGSRCITKFQKYGDEQFGFSRECKRELNRLMREDKEKREEVKMLFDSGHFCWGEDICDDCLKNPNRRQENEDRHYCVYGPCGWCKTHREERFARGSAQIEEWIESRLEFGHYCPDDSEWICEACLKYPDRCQANKEKRLKMLAEQQAERERRIAEQQAEQERLKAEQERRMAEQRAEQERRMAEQRAEQERRMAEQRAEQERRMARQRAEQERLRVEREQLEAERLAKWNEYIKTHFCEYDLCRWCKDNPDIWEKRFTEYMANKRPTFNTNLSGIIKPITKKK